MGSFSLIDEAMQSFTRGVEERAQLMPCNAWSDEERTATRRADRRARAAKDFAYFDRTYFPPDMYPDGYAKPCRMHKELVGIFQTPGVHIVLGPRDHGKTQTAKKITAWLLLTGRVHMFATYSHTVHPSSSNLLVDIGRIIAENPRIVEDWSIEFIEQNTEQIRFRVGGESRIRVGGAYSEGKSLRGFSAEFGRPELVLCDDVETLTSPLGEEAAKGRIEKVDEAYHSLTRRGTLVWLGNNFSTKTATNRLLKLQEKGLLAEHWSVHVYRAWHLGRPLWRERFPANSETEMKRLVRARDEADWSGNFQQAPVEEDGLVFRREFYIEYTEIPRDARGVVYCDPNLSLRGAGDTAALGALLYSPTTDKYYVRGPRAKSYSDSNELLDDYMHLKRGDIYACGFDGHVNQESSWTNNVRNYCRLKKVPFPRIEYRRYNVDLLMKTAQAVWCEQRILFPPGFSQTEEGQKFLAQVFPFAGKKAGKKDDAADWLICAFELIHEQGLAHATRPSSVSATAFVEDYYS